MNRGDKIRYKDNQQLAALIHKLTGGVLECCHPQENDKCYERCKNDDYNIPDEWCIKCIKRYLDEDGEI